ncbi:MAG: hypothetical protein IKX88_16125 [Thermoguttaceae bacterium]|nr:hypothetical protein [Thermoguttaceae bacterium]
MSRKKGSAPFSLFAFQDAITSVCGVVVLITLLLAVQLTTRAIDEEELNVESNAQRVQEIRREAEERRQAIKTLEETQVLSDVDRDVAALSASDLEARKERVESRLESARQESARLRREIDDAKKLEGPDSDVRKKIDELREKNRLTQDELKAIEAKSNEPIDENVVLFSYSESAKEKPWFVDISGSAIVAHPTAEGETTQEFASDEEFLKWAKRRSRNREYFVLIVRPSGAAFNDVVSMELEDVGFKIGIDLVGENRKLEFMAVRGKGASR